MHLVVFDIDGTLTQSMDLDTRCYAQALMEVLELDSVDTDWSRYRRVTDIGIATELCHRHRPGTSVTENVQAIRRRFVHLLAEAIERDEDACRAVPGALRMLKRLRAEPTVAVAIATGAWPESAAMKLQRAGIDPDGLPLATCDDASARTEIMAAAHRHALQSRGIASFATITSVGDAVWDVQAAREAGYRFIGIGCSADAERLREAGAELIFDDFTGGFLASLMPRDPAMR